uniref:SHSP domain-containing protein n=1 Tax=Panagrolaimus sp. ES5 TaxID=591445 RepID=A0AC34F0U5_9BILA
MNEIIFDQIEDKHRFESERIKERDKITRRMIEERYEEEKEKVERQYEAAVAQLAEKMIAENEEERRQLEAELAVIGEDGEVPANFSYLPNRKQLRRRAGNLNDSATEQTDKIDPYVPIYQVHWIDPKDISSDLNVVNSVLQFSDEGPFEKHLSIQVQDGKLILDGKTYNRGLNQVMMIKSQTYGEFPAIMLSLCDNCITVRSIIKGDPRHIAITRSDLENGRVRISKRTT